MLEETKDSLKPDEREIPRYRLSDLLLFLISALAIFFSPFGQTGISVISGLFPTLTPQQQFSLPLEALLFLIGIIPFGILLKRKKRILAVALVIFAFVDMGYFLFLFLSALSNF